MRKLNKDKSKETREKRNKQGITIEGDVERGFTTIENYVLKLPYLSPNPRCLLNAFFMYQNCKETFLSYNTIMKYTGISSDMTVTKWLRFLEWIGFLDIRRYLDEDNMPYNIYKLNHNRIQDFARYIKEIDITFKEIEEYWNKNANTTTKAKELLKDKESFIVAIKKILNNI